MPMPPHSRHSLALGPMGLALVMSLAGLALAPGPALGEAPRKPAPGEVIGYAEADRSGASQAWAIPADQPYLYVPALPHHMGGKVSAVEVGPEVGVALFQGPYFTARDQGCQPVLGTLAQPDRRWLGATAHFAPAPPEQAEAEAGGEPPQSYGSMIIYRSVLGPPPGALLLERRPTIGVRCPNPVLGILYNRIFVPMAEAPAKQRCFDLSENYPGALEPFALEFLNSDRMVLLMPGDMSARYQPIVHNITVSLYERLSCRGPSITVNSRVADHKDLRLAQAGFRAAARSLRVSYVDGNAEAFLARPEPAPVAVSRPAPEPPAQPQLARPIEAPPVPPAQIPAEMPAVSPALERPAASPAPEPATATPVPAVATAGPEDVAPEPAAAPVATPQLARPALAPSAPPPAAETRVLTEVDTSSAGTPTRAEPQAVTKLEPSRPATPEAPPEPAPPSLAEVLGEYKTAALAPGAASAAAGARTFAYPVQDIYRLDHCLNWQRDCGKAAALAWCQAQGFTQAVDWRVDEDIGANFPTFVMGEKKVCAQATCDGFKEITCAP